MGVSARNCKGKDIWYDPNSDTYSHIKQNNSDVNFDSEFEFGVWKILRRSVPKTHTLERQHKVFLNPETRFFRAGNWKCDFAVVNNIPESGMYEHSELLIEAKGTITDEFKWLCKLLSVCNPEALDKLIIVTPSKESFGNLRVVQPKNLPSLMGKLL